MLLLQQRTYRAPGITGKGDLRLGPEELDLSIEGEPKTLRFARLRTPIEIGGHLRKPKVGIDAGKALKQGAVAGAIDAALAPIAAIIAFVDPGLAKDENCAALLSTAQPPPTHDGGVAHGGTRPPVASRRRIHDASKGHYITSAGTP